jgi:hypothetical protein
MVGRDDVEEIKRKVEDCCGILQEVAERFLGD